MQAVSIQMRCDHHLEVFTPDFPRKLCPNLVCLLRRHLTLGKTLIGVVCDDAAGLSELLFDNLKLSSGNGRVVVDAGHIKLLLCLFLVDRVVHHVIQGIGQQAGIGLLRIHGVIDGMIQSAAYRPDFRYRHMTLPFSGIRNFC